MYGFIWLKDIPVLLIKLKNCRGIIFGEPYVPEVTGRRGTSEELQAIADEMLRQAYALGGQQVGGAPL